MKFLIFALIVAIVYPSAVSSSNDIDIAWNNFKAKHGKLYHSPNQETIRKAVFSQNYQKISKHNNLYAEGLRKFSQKINKYADMTHDEIRNTINGYKKNSKSAKNQHEVPPLEVNSFALKDYDDPIIPEQKNWIEEGAVTAVKDQGECGSSWAFTVTGALEGQHFLKTGKLVSLSEQNLIDCSQEYGNYGCAGGDILSSFVYVHDNDGIDSEESYPYEMATLVCRYEVADNVTSISGYGKVKSSSEKDLKAAVAIVGPIAVAMDSSDDNLHFYANGVFRSRVCKNTINDLDHAVLVVGYGSKNGNDYWLVKNSWGVDWGDEGYFKIARNANNNCGLATAASFPQNYV